MKTRGFGVLLIAWLPAAAWPHVGERVFLVQELPTADLPDLHDGTLEDWEAALPFQAFDITDMGHAGFGDQPLDPEDIAARVFLAWNDRAQQLYVAIEFVDDVGDRRDQFRLMLDGDHSGGAYDPAPTVREGLEERTQAQSYDVATYPQDSAEALSRRSGLTGWAYHEPWVDLGHATLGEAPAQSIVEMAITPWDAMVEAADGSRRSQLVAGRVIGLQLAFPDFDEDLETVWSIGGATVGSSGFDGTANAFADAELIACDRLDCSGTRTAVAPDSWARIKAGVGGGWP